MQSQSRFQVVAGKPIVDLALTELTKMAKSSWLSIDEIAELY